MIEKIIALVKHLNLKLKLKRVSGFIQKGNSHFFNNFNLQLNKPIANKKYLIVGDDSILDCSIVFETAQGQVECGNNTFISGSTIICRSKIVFEDYVFVAWGGYFYNRILHLSTGR